MKLFVKLLCVILSLTLIVGVSACGGSSSDGGSDTAQGSTVISNGESSSDSGSDPDDDEELPDYQSIYIVYDLNCDDDNVSIPSTRQVVHTGEAYTLVTPYVPVLASVEFKGWKNKITGEMFPESGTYTSQSNVYLVAVWTKLGPKV